jgi:hypothetical protein
VIGALVLVVTFASFATAGSFFVYGIPNHNGLTVLFNISIFVYCSAGLGALLLTITWPNEPVSLTLVESTPPNELAQRVV